MTQPGLTALIGPMTASAANHVQCMAHSMHVPHIETRFDYSNILSPYSINIHPAPSVLGRVSYICSVIISIVTTYHMK